jgi:hypothetical protein
MPPTSSPARCAMRSTCAMISAGGVGALDAQPVLRRVERAGARVSSTPSAVWQASAGQRLKPVSAG